MGFIPIIFLTDTDSIYRNSLIGGGNMRTAREKINSSGCYYHLMNRATGYKNDYPFTSEDKEKGMQVIRKLAEYYLLEIISVCWMGNHFHIVLYAPGNDEMPDMNQIVQRHNSFFERNPQRQINSGDKTACGRTAANMRDISHFMKIFQQIYTRYLNRTKGRRGRFWADRFKSTILEGRQALWSAVKYVELNPVRGGLVSDPADYRHSTWGWYCGSGQHLFEKSFHKHMRRSLGEGSAESWSMNELSAEFRGELARTIAYEQNLSEEETAEAIKKAKREETMSVRFLRRTRHFTDGGIVGSKLFIMETAALFRDQEKVMKKQFSQGKTQTGIPLYCYKMLRNQTE